MKEFSKLEAITKLYHEAQLRSEYGPAINIGPAVYVYPSLACIGYFAPMIVSRIPESDLWVRHDELEGIHTFAALLVLGRSLSDIIEELRPESYGWEVPEASEELAFPDQELIPQRFV